MAHARNGTQNPVTTKTATAKTLLLNGRRVVTGRPEAQGLYSPANEHDACGIGMIANIRNKPSHEVVEKGLEILENLEHRGAVGAEANTGDGTGLLIQVPDLFLRAVVREELNIELPEAGAYATGLCFLPQSRMLAMDAMRMVERVAAEQGVTVIGWREVPVDDSSVGAISRDAQPTIRQIFVKAAGPDGTLLTDVALERRCFVVRKRCEHELGSKGAGRGDLGSETVYFPSLSPRTFVYKGMLTEKQLPEFYLDLQDERVESALGIVHSRFSTNTFPSWPLAHPFRRVAHNGEINTVTGNENWMRAREALIDSELLGPLDRVLPICSPDGSDTARFDEALELLHLGGYSLPHAMAMMIPQAWEHNPTIDPELRDFYEYHSCLMEPWDGPAAVAFTDGTVIGAVLDRNGLRPGRIWVTRDGLVVMASEAGVLDLDPRDVVKRTRVQPGRMFLVDTAAGRIVPDEEIKASLASAKPYRTWINENFVHIENLPQTRYEYMPHNRAVLRQRVFGITEEDVDLIIAPMALNAAEAIGSMGSDTPIAALSQRPRMLYDFFAQRFAQVTNPPLDAIREKPVTSMDTLLGAQSDVLHPGPEAARRIRIDGPVLDNHDLESGAWGGYLGIGEHPQFKEMANSRCNGEAMKHYVLLSRRLNELGIKEEAYLPLAKRVARFYTEAQLSGGSFGRWWTAKGKPADTQGTNGAYIGSFFCTLITALDDDDPLKADLESALHRAYGHYGQLANEGAFYGDTLDADSCDKEAGVALLSFFLDLYEMDGDKRHLESATLAARFIVQWIWQQDSYLDPESPLRVMGFSTRGMTSVSVAHHHLDFYGMAIAYEFLRYSSHTGDDFFRAQARLMIEACRQLVATPDKGYGRDASFIGWQAEQLNHTAWEYFNRPSLMGGHFDIDIAWVTVLTLGAYLLIRDGFGEMVE